MLSRLSLAVALAVSLGGCAADVDGDDDDGIVIDETDETSAALTSPDPSSGADSDGECTDADKDAQDHKKHRKHKFKMLDRLDGAKDRSVVIASLPAGLSEKLIAKLNKIDTDQDGVVTKAEAKVWWKKKNRGG